MREKPMGVGGVAKPLSAREMGIGDKVKKPISPDTSVPGVRQAAPSAPPERASWFGLLAAMGVCLVVVLMVLAPFFSVILLAVVAAGLIDPFYRRLVIALNGHRKMAGVVICLILLVVLLVPLFVIAQEVSQEARGIYELSTTQLTEGRLRSLLEERQGQIEDANRLLKPLGFEMTTDRVYDLVATSGVRIGGFFYKQGVSLAKHLLRFVFGFIFWVLILYYLLVDGRRFAGWFEDSLPLPANEQRLVAHRFMDMASSLVIGNGVAAVIQGVLGGLVFSILGLHGAVLWGVVMAILAFIPVVGISLVFVPFSLILLLAGETSRAVWLFVPLALVATVVEYWLKPLLVGRRAQMHTLLVFLSLIGGAMVFGAVGLLLGPLMMTAFLTLAGIYRERYSPFVGQSAVFARELPVDDEVDSNRDNPVSKQTD
ncbi:MAG: AI-2E family transporter [Thermoanaerobaculales bacterium]|nr:AI-2E family transporter [Thermoanaerobaculales bacterium]